MTACSGNRVVDSEHGVRAVLQCGVTRVLPDGISAGLYCVLRCVSM